MTDQLSLFDFKSDRMPLDSALQQELDPITIAKDAPGALLINLVPENAMLEVNRGYPTRSTDVSRIMRMAQEKRFGGEPVSRETISVSLGIPWARTEGTMNVMRRAELLELKNDLSPLGYLVVESTPFLDDASLLWLLHYLVASDARVVLWSHLFDSILMDLEEVSIDQSVGAFAPLSGRWSLSSLSDKANKRLGAIFRTYAEELFKPLGLLSKRDRGIYSVQHDTALIPPLVWLGCILAYRDRYYAAAPSLETALIVNAHFSPGRILRQREIAVRRALDELHNVDLLTVETRLGLDQIRFKRDVSWLSAVDRYFEERRAS